MRSFFKSLSGQISLLFDSRISSLLDMVATIWEGMRVLWAISLELLVVCIDVSLVDVVVVLPRKFWSDYWICNFDASRHKSLFSNGSSSKSPIDSFCMWETMRERQMLLGGGMPSEGAIDWVHQTTMFNYTANMRLEQSTSDIFLPSLVILLSGSFALSMKTSKVQSRGWPWIEGLALLFRNALFMVSNFICAIFQCHKTWNSSEHCFGLQTTTCKARAIAPRLALWFLAVRHKFYDFTSSVYTIPPIVGRYAVRENALPFVSFRIAMTKQRLETKQSFIR